MEIISEDEYHYVRHGVATVRTDSEGNVWYQFRHPFLEGVVASEEAFINLRSDGLNLKVLSWTPTTEGFGLRAYLPNGEPMIWEPLTFMFLVTRRK